MRILTFTTLYPNAEQPNNAIFVQHRMAAVNRLPGAEVRVVAPVPWFPDISFGSERWRVFARVPRQETRAGVQVFHPRYLVTPKIGMTLYGLYMFLGVLPTMKKIFQEWPFDVIDAHYVYPDGVAAMLFGRLFRRPVVVSARGTDINLYPQFRLIRPLIRWVVTRADGLISVCRSLSDIMVDLGAQQDKVWVIPNGIDPHLFYPKEQRAARMELDLGEKQKILLTVGALIERKGIHLLIEALHLLKEQGKLEFSTYIVGKGELKGLLETLVEQYGLSRQVFLVGEVANERLACWYNAADLFFLGSSREGWPNVVSESLACGTAVIATPVDGIPDIIHSPKLGSVVERDPRLFATALEQGFRQNWNREYISDVGQKRTWQKVAHEVKRVLEQVIKQSGGKEKNE
ncbi:glycosyltransferase family 4 protein [Thermodesulfobacteriota bacterium B35]